MLYVLKTKQNLICLTSCTVLCASWCFLLIWRRGWITAMMLQTCIEVQSGWCSCACSYVFVQVFQMRMFEWGQYWVFLKKQSSPAQKSELTCLLLLVCTTFTKHNLPYDNQNNHLLLWLIELSKTNKTL